MKTQNLKKLALLCIGFLIVACSKTDLSEVDENETLAQEKNEVELLETPESKNFIAIGWPPGIYGKSSVDAYESATYSYILTQAEQNAVPSNLRKFKVRFQVWSGGKWKQKAFYNNQPSTVTAAFPKHGNGNAATWRIGFQMYNKNTGTSYSKKWKNVTVFNN